MESLFPVLCSSKPLKPELEKFQRIPITSEVFKLGRGHQNTVILPNKCLSKDHCIFKKVEDDWMLENCSYSSIKVNGNKLRKGQKCKLHDQDIIKLDSSNELVYMFSKNSNARKRRKHDRNDENIKKRLEEPSTTSNQNEDDKTQFNTSEKQKEQIMLEQSRKEKQICNEYASRIEKLKGSKRTVKRQKDLLKVKRDAQLASMRVEMAEKMASMMEKTLNDTEKRENSPKDPSKQVIYPEVSPGTPRQEAVYRLRARIREQDRMRMREKKELRKLRKETEQLRLDREKKLKELEKQKLIREKELQEELNKLNKKLAKQIELHETEKRRAEQLLNQQKQLKGESSPGDSNVDMESELLCSVCSELFVRATTLGCSHSFCQYCIKKWHSNKRECPICRAPIKSMCRSIVLDSLVEKMTETSEPGKRKRQELVQAREALEATEPSTADSNRLTFFPDYGFSPELRDYYEDENSESNSSYYGRESSLEPDPDLLVMDDDDDEEAEGESSEEFSMSDHRDEDEIDEFVDDDEDGGNSPEDYDEHDSAPENYDEGENSAPENYDEGENSAPEYEEPDNSAPEYEEPDNSAPEDNCGENYEENYDHENSAPEFDENDYDENSPPYDVGENYPDYGDYDNEDDDDY